MRCYIGLADAFKVLVSHLLDASSSRYVTNVMMWVSLHVTQVLYSSSLTLIYLLTLDVSCVLTGMWLDHLSPGVLWC